MYLIWKVLLLFFSGPSSETGTLLGPFPTYKTWWAKELVRGDLYTAGRLTETQIKYAHEVGFNSMISMFDYETGSEIGEEILPSGDEEVVLATRVVGLEFAHILSPGEPWRRLETVERFGKAYRSLTKPILYHCNSAYSATATTLMYFMNETMHNPEAEPKVTLDEFFRQSAAIGFDFGSDEPLMDLIRELTGLEDIEVSVRPNVSMAQWNSKYWLTRPIHDNWYAAGQIRSNYIPMVKNFDAVINLRSGLVSEDTGEPSQGEVTLLNVKDDTGTYTGEGRQTETELEKNRINPDRPNSYINPNSTVNYEMRNRLEFGDTIGYNEESEGTDLSEQDVEYHHISLGKNSALEQWRTHKSLFLRVGQSKDAILIHSRNGENAVMFGLLSAGCQHDYGSEWALEKARRLGFHWHRATHPEVLIVLTTVLENRDKEC